MYMDMDITSTIYWRTERVDYKFKLYRVKAPNKIRTKSDEKS